MEDGVGVGVEIELRWEIGIEKEIKRKGCGEGRVERMVGWEGVGECW